MISESNVLVVSTVLDTATDAVVGSLARRGVAFRRINSEDVPFARSLTINYQDEPGPRLVFDGCALKPTAIWYRRIRTPACPDGMDEGVYDFCVRESRATLVGGLMAQSVRWMSDPEAVWRAEFKLFQLRIAREVGFRIPKTIVTNEPQAVRRAYGDFGPLVVKPAKSGHFRRGGEEFSIYTSQIAEEHLAAIDDAKWTPSIYQELIPKRFDVRVTCVGDRLFSAAIHSQSDPEAAIDWRRTSNPQLPHSTIHLPDDVAVRIKSLMRRLDLQFGCVDLVLTPEGEYVFLEVNPSGQWLWLDDQLELGISDAVASWLANAPGQIDGD